MTDLSLSDHILQGNDRNVIELIRNGYPINERDEYGGTPLIQAAMCEKNDIALRLLNQGADWTLQDLLGCDPLYWAIDTANVELTRMLLEKGANPNTFNSESQPALVLPLLRKHTNLIHLLTKHGATQSFAEDYIRVKLTGHLFELTGTGDIIGPDKNYVPVKYEGFVPEFTLGMIQSALDKFISSFSNKGFISFFDDARTILTSLNIASQLRGYRHFAIDLAKYRDRIHGLIKNKLLIIPVTYQGHAIAFVYYQGLWAKCDRGHRSKPDETAVIFKVRDPSLINESFIERLLYEKQTDYFINEGINQYLGLTPLEKIPTHSQLAGNCSWANIEATIPVMLFMLGYQRNQGLIKTPLFKRSVMVFYEAFVSWNKDRLIDEAIEIFHSSERQRKASICALLSAILFQRTNEKNKDDIQRGKKIVSIIKSAPYDIFLRSYIQSYCQEALGPIAQKYKSLLTACGVKVNLYI